MRLILHTLIIGKTGQATTVTLYSDESKRHPYELVVAAETQDHRSKGSSVHKLFVDALLQYSAVVRELTRDEEF